MFKQSKSSVALIHALSNLYQWEEFDSHLLNSGGFADVYKAVNLKSGEVVVIKKPKRRVSQPIMTKESELMIKLDHKNILKAIGVIIQDGIISLITEFINGGSLQSFVKDMNNILPWTTRIKLGVDVANGMNYLNKMGYIHRDLTSFNILIRMESNLLNAVICDFGLAAKIPTKGKVLPSVGTPFCRAPESIRGEYYDQKADVFSFGIILCELLLRCDYDPDNLPRTQNYGVDYRKIGEMVEDCPVSLLALAFICCHMDPEKRPSFVDISLCLDTTLIHCCTYGYSHQAKTSELKKWQSLDDLLITQEPEVFDDILSGSCKQNLSPRALGEIMTRLDPDYTSNELDLSNLLNQTATIVEKRVSCKNDSYDLESFNTCSSSSSINYQINSLPLTRQELQALGDRCLCVLPSDKNLRKNSERQSPSFDRSIRPESTHLSILNTDSGISSRKERILTLQSQSVSDKNSKGFSIKSFDFGDDILRHFFRQSTSSINSSSDIAEDTNQPNFNFYRFMRQYLIACMKSQHPVKTNGRRVYLPPECLKRMKEARELFRSREK